jgi:serine/threonine-protein kinase
MGTVYVGADLCTGERVAIKWLNAAELSGSKDLARFEQEARIAGTLASPHIARVFDVGRDAESGVSYLVMELLQGENLESLLDRVGPLSTCAALRIAAQACAGLSAAHEAGVVHRDIKPSNLFLSRGEAGEVVVKLLDFGVAKIRRLPANAPARSGALAAPTVSMTETGQVLDSPLFMSPEQVEMAKHVDARSDVFSLGVTLYAMLTGAAPYAKIKSFVQLLYTIVNEPAPPLGTVVPGVPVELSAVVDRAMSHAPEERHANAAEMLAALLPLLPDGMELREEMLVGAGRVAGAPPGRTLPGAEEGAAQAPQAGGAAEPEPRKKWAWLMAAVVLMGVVVAGALLLR